MNKSNFYVPLQTGGSSLLFEEENEKLFQILNERKIKSSCSAVVELLHSNDVRDLWLRSGAGVACICQDEGGRTFIRVFNLFASKQIFEQQIHPKLDVRQPTDRFITFETESGRAGLSFAANEEAERFAECLKAASGLPRRHTVATISKSTAGGFPVSSSLHDVDERTQVSSHNGRSIEPRDLAKSPLDMHDIREIDEVDFDVTKETGHFNRKSSLTASARKYARTVRKEFVRFGRGSLRAPKRSNLPRHPTLEISPPVGDSFVNVCNIKWDMKESGISGISTHFEGNPQQLQPEIIALLRAIGHDPTKLTAEQRQSVYSTVEQKGGVEFLRQEMNRTAVTTPPPPPPPPLQHLLPAPVTEQSGRNDLLDAIRNHEGVSKLKSASTERKASPRAQKKVEEARHSLGDMIEAIQRALNTRHKAIHGESDTDEETDNEDAELWGDDD